MLKLFLLLLVLTESSIGVYSQFDAQFKDDAGLQGSKSGFFHTPSPVNFPAGANNWWHLLDTRHTNTSNNFAMQFAGSFFDQNLYFRKTNNNASQAWSKVVLETEGKAVISSNLHVVGTGPGTGFIWAIGPEALVGWKDRTLAADNNLWGWYASNGTTALWDNASQLNRMSITNTGIVRIGTNITPSTSTARNYKLIVDGAIGASDVYVTLTRPWPDYVFSRNYKLRNLNSLEKYIKANKHLPNVPSAAELDKEGSVNLGELNAKLLEKVEELTLYVIELQKQVDRLSKKK